MIKLEHVVLASPEQMEFIIEGMRNPMNSWEKSDSEYETAGYDIVGFDLGENDHSLMQRLSNAGTDHRKFMRMMPVYVRITAPLYWWKEFDTYKVGTVSNSCRERQAQTMANATVAAKKKDNPDMTKAEVKKASQQALAQARSSVGAKRSNIEITDKEWEAIQAGAISENKLTQILNNTNTDTIRQRATPRASTSLSTAKQNRIAALSASGYSTSEIAEALGVSSSTVSKYLNGKE